MHISGHIVNFCGKVALMVFLKRGIGSFIAPKPSNL
jgi:hypothetical protein